MTRLVERIVLGTPAPQGSKRLGANGAIFESSRKVAPWREAVVSQVRDVWDSAPVDGPVCVGVTFYLARPKAAKRLRWSSKRPDIDKLVRSTLDALTTVGVFGDDAQVSKLVAEKRYIDDVQTVPCAHLVIDTLA